MQPIMYTKKYKGGTFTRYTTWSVRVAYQDKIKWLSFKSDHAAKLQITRWIKEQLTP